MSSATCMWTSTTLRRVSGSSGVWAQGALADRGGVRLVTVSACALFLTRVLTLRMWRPLGFDATEAAAVSVEPVGPH